MDEEGRRLLAGFVRSREPSATQRSAAWSAVSERIRLGDPGPQLEPEPLPGSVPAAAKLGLVVVGALVAAVAGILLGRPDMDRRTRVAKPMLRAVTVKPQTVVAPLPPPSPAVEQPSSAPESPAGEADSTPSAPRRRRRPKTASKPAAPAPPASSLAEEMRLLRSASGQLKAGRPSRALATLAEHARRFPEGTLSAEREIKRAEAHCSNGDREASRRIADRFVREHPGTALRSRARSICREGEE